MTQPLGRGKNPTRRRALRLEAAFLACVAVGFTAQPAWAQYFGRNRVEYADRDYQVLATPHFGVHFGPVAPDALQDAARMAERWYERIARFLQHDFIESPKPLIVYADQQELQETNTLDGFIREARGGFIESLSDRVVLPLTGSYAVTDHVLGHEVVHAFQYDLAKSLGRKAVSDLVAVPLWLLEGMAEYLSVGAEDPHTAMWLRDAVLRGRFPSLPPTSGESPYVRYRFGQAFWAYIGGAYGDQTVATLYRRTLRLDFETAVRELFGKRTDALYAEWRRQVEAAYRPLMAGRQDPRDVGTAILSPATGSSSVALAPALSPDGRTVAFLSEQDILSFDLLLADARTGRVLRKLASVASDDHLDALAWSGTSGAFSPEGTVFAYVVVDGGRHRIELVALANGDVLRSLNTPGVGSIAGPAWSPDGRQIAFTGTVGGVSDLFLYDLSTDQVRQLTHARHADDHPAWSPDGTTLVFATDRGPETDYGRLVYSEPRIAFLNVATGDVRVLEVFGDVRHSNPQYTPDGQGVYFLSDRDGFSDIYRLDVASGRTDRITRLATGVGGVTSHAPALSVASRTGELAFSVFTDSGFHIHVLERDPAGTPVTVTAAANPSGPDGRRLPPLGPGRPSRVAAYLGDPELGLGPAEVFSLAHATPYQPTLTLDRWGPAFLNPSAERWGSHIGSPASLYFGDLMGNRHLGVALRPAFSLGEVGGEFFYGDVTRPWNWMVAGAYAPFRLVRHEFDSDDDRFYLEALNLRVLESRARGEVGFPLSTTRRIEVGAGVSHIDYQLWENRFYMDPSRSFFTGEVERVDHDARCSELPVEELELGDTPCMPDRMNLMHATVGWVGDDSFFGLTSPIRGGRFRVALEATMGAESFVTVVADWRRYFAPSQNLTVAARGLHMSRYGDIQNVQAIQPWFLGGGNFVRGYALESFQPFECPPPPVDPSGFPLPPRPHEEVCPTFSRLVGQRLAVANLELRVPLLGFDHFGLIRFPWLPTELVLFGDAGLAWDKDHPPTLELSRSALERVPVFSAGVSARLNVAGLLVLEAYHAYPFQRPGRGSHWGFLVSPGW